MILCGFQFYGYYAIDNNIRKFTCMLLIPVLMILSCKQILMKEKDIFFRIMRLMLFSWLFSMIMSLMFWNQPLMLSYRATASSLFFIIFFYFCKTRPTRKSLEKIIVIFGWLYIFLWLYSLSRAPEITFGWSSDGELSDDMSRGMVRINFTGRLSLIFAYFYYLNKSFTKNNVKYKIFAMVFFVFLILQLTRQLILWTGVVTIIYIFFKAKRLSIILTVLFASLYISSTTIEFSDDSVIGSMINVTNKQINGDLYEDEDPRLVEYQYFFTKWSKNVITDAFGNGVPHFDSDYGKYEERLRQNGIYLSDVGYPSMFVLLGIFGLSLYLILYVKGMLQKLPKDLTYVQMFMGFLIPANIAASWYKGADTQLATCICVYIIYTYHKNSKLLESHEN